MTDFPALPAGFVLEGAPAPAPAPAPAQVPPLPEGFQLEAPPAAGKPAYSGTILPFSRDDKGNVSFDTNAGFIGEIKRAALGGAELGQAALEGRLDPTSEAAAGKAFMGATLGAPISAGSRLAMGRAAAPAAGVAGDAADLGIGLTAGQRTADPVLLSTENAMFGGAKGPAAQQIAQEAVKQQQDQILAARQTIGDTAGRGQADLARSADAGDAAIQGIKQAAGEAKADYQQKYDIVRDQEGSLDPRFFQGFAREGAQEVAVPGSTQADFAAPLSRRIIDSLVNRHEPVIIDDTLTPAASKALTELDKVTNLQLGKIGQPGADDEVIGINLRGVDQARRKLAAYSRAAKGNDADARAVGSIIGEFDGQLQRAMENGLFSGSDDALTALKDARAAFASYQRTFKPQGAGDDVGQAMRAIMERDATPEQVANYLYGSTKVGAQGRSVRMADRLKGVLGEESPEWAAIRQGAWQRVTGPADTGAKRAADRILDFVDGEGKSLSTRLYSEDERAQMRKLGNVLGAIASKPGTINPSNSGNRLAGLARETFASVMAMVGATATGPMGAAAGYAAGRGMNSIGNARAASTARNLFAGREPVTIGQKLKEGLAPPPLSFVIPKFGGHALPGSIPGRAESEEDQPRFPRY